MSLSVVCTDRGEKTDLWKEPEVIDWFSEGCCYFTPHLRPPNTHTHTLPHKEHTAIKIYFCLYSGLPRDHLSCFHPNASFSSLLCSPPFFTVSYFSSAVSFTVCVWVTHMFSPRLWPHCRRNERQNSYRTLLRTWWWTTVNRRRHNISSQSQRQTRTLLQTPVMTREGRYSPDWWRKEDLVCRSRPRWNSIWVSSRTDALRQRWWGRDPWLWPACRRHQPCCLHLADWTLPHSSHCGKFLSATGLLTPPFHLEKEEETHRHKMESNIWIMSLEPFAQFWQVLFIHLFFSILLCRWQAFQEKHSILTKLKCRLVKINLALDIFYFPETERKFQRYLICAKEFLKNELVQTWM